MRRSSGLFGLSLATFLVLGICHAQPRQDALDRALEPMGETRTSLRVDPDYMTTRSGSEFKLPIFDQWFNHPTRIPTFERHLRDVFLESRGKLQIVFNTAAAAIGMGTRRSLIPPTPLDNYHKEAEAPYAILRAIQELDSTADIPLAVNVPLEVRHAAAMLLFAINDAMAWREMALRELGEAERASLYAWLIEPLERSIHDSASAPEAQFPSGFRRVYEKVDLLAKIDYRLLNSAADDFTGMIDAIVAELDTLKISGSFDYRCSTRYGEIRLTRGTDDTYAATDHYLLIMDLSGDDTYETGGASGGEPFPVGLLLDAAGNDRYVAANDKPCFGAGVLGWGIVADLDGNDHYHTKGFYAQGCGLAGVGLLLDRGGNDTYDAIGGAQGLGQFGVGILCDGGGNDVYQSYVQSQGCGLPMGFGLLFDRAGNDQYIANDTDILFPSPQTKEHNGSMCQGAGYGVRRDYLDGHSLAGGVGMLLDSSGNDSYFGGVFAQAVGYWFAIGILDDRDGNDRYRSVWYGQSATAHMGVSYLAEGRGNDSYEGLMTMTAGAAHDLSVSVFVEEAGNDTFTQAANTLGRSLNSSVSLFVEAGGDDRYQAKDVLGYSVNGSSTGWRAEAKTIGIFLDLDGNDTYPQTPMRNNSIWLQESTTPVPALRAIGMDGRKLKVRWD